MKREQRSFLAEKHGARILREVWDADFGGVVLDFGLVAGVFWGGSLSGKEKRGQVASVGDLKRLRRNVYSDCGDVAVTLRGVE